MTYEADQAPNRGKVQAAADSIDHCKFDFGI